MRWFWHWNPHSPDPTPSKEFLKLLHSFHFSFQPHQKPQVCHASMFLGVSCTFPCVPTHLFPHLSSPDVCFSLPFSVSSSLSPSLICLVSIYPLSMFISVSLGLGSCLSCSFYFCLFSSSVSVHL